MAYEKNTWAAGDVVTAAKLNNMENGIANAGNVFVINGEVSGVSSDQGEYVYGTISVDKTIEEIKAALEGGNLVLFQLNGVYSNSDYRVLNDMAGIYGIQSYNFDTAGDWMVSIQQISHIYLDEYAVTVDVVTADYEESGDPAAPDGEWTFSIQRKNINLDSGSQ